jgi:acetylornithine/succinyldiaminopimelate/putrescine aminotransferase
MLEPIQGESGVHVLDEELLGAAREACDEHGAALIFDEIQTGMGRTGTLWAYEQSGVVPDAITSAKALGGGLPIGALITGERLAGALRPGDHGSTFAGGPVVATAALQALALTADPELLEGVMALGGLLAAGLERLPHVLEVRGRGLMLACELDTAAPAVAREAPLAQRDRDQRDGSLDDRLPARADDHARAGAGRARAPRGGAGGRLGHPHACR